MLFSLSSAHLAWCARNAKPGKNHQQNVASDTCHYPNTTWSKSTRAECVLWDVRDVRESTEGLSLSQILKVRTSPNTLHNWYQFLNWIEELILISLPAFPQCFQSLKSETFGKQEAKRIFLLSLRNNDLKKAKSPEGCETHSIFFDSYRCTDWRRNSQKERNEKKKRQVLTHP